MNMRIRSDPTWLKRGGPVKQLPDTRGGLQLWGELLAREKLDRPPWAPTADPGV